MTRTLLVSLLFLSCVGCDQVTKSVARTHLATSEGHSFLNDVFRLTYAENSGAFLSFGDAMPESIKTTIFIVVVGLISLGALLAAYFARGLSQRQVVSLALIASGGVGNWIDRVMRDGHVTDFLNLGIGSLRTGIFNVADMVLVAGVALYFLSELKMKRPPEARA